MYDFIKNMIDKLPEDMIGNKPTPAPEYLFKTDDPDAILLSKAKSEEFHHITAKTLYLGKRGHPNLQLATAFLCTRVKAPDEYDYKNYVMR